MTAEFNIWLLLVGLIVGGGLTWLVVGELRRSEGDIGQSERELEADWIVDQLAGTDRSVSEEQADAVLQLHQRYLATSLPPTPLAGDEGSDEADADPGSDAPAAIAPPPDDGSTAGQHGDIATRTARPTVTPPPRRQRGHRPTS
jgi:hypothetical protein